MTSMTLPDLEDPMTPAEDTAAVQPPAQKTLESSAIHATYWTVLEYCCAMGLRVVNSMVLTHLLLPEHFGLMTLVTTLIVGIGLLSDIGLIPSVIQSPRGDEPVFLNTAWTLQVVRGGGIFVVSLILAWPMSHLYHEPRLLLLLPALGFNILITSFCSTNLLSLSRHMGVRRLFLLGITGQLFAFVATAGLALIYRSVWTLVVGNILSSIYRLVFSFYRPLIPGIRNSFCWDKESTRELVQFGKWILLSTAFYFFASQADRLILGKLITLSMLGVYGIAYSVSDIPRAVISAFSLKVGYPFIAKMGHLPLPEFRKVFLRYRFYALLAGVIMLCVVVNAGGFVVAKMYDSRYHAASWMVPILALGLWHTLLYSTTMPALFTLGKSQYSAIGNAAYCVAVITAIPLAFTHFGITGAVVAVAAGDLPLYFVTLFAAHRERLSTWKQDLQVSSIFLLVLGLSYLLREAILARPKLF